MSAEERRGVSRRVFVRAVSGAGLAAGLAGVAVRNAAAAAGDLDLELDDAPKDLDGEIIPGFEKTKTDPNASKGWQALGDRKLRVGIAGYGLCRFGAAFSFQTHPNVEVVAVTDLDPNRCAGLAQACRCRKTYPSCEEMVKDDNIEAVFIATDAPSHARLAVEALKHGKHAASAVPAVFGSDALEDAQRLCDALNMTLAGTVAHESALRDGRWMKIPQYEL